MAGSAMRIELPPNAPWLSALCLRYWPDGRFVCLLLLLRLVQSEFQVFRSRQLPEQKVYQC